MAHQLEATAYVNERVSVAVRLRPNASEGENVRGNVSVDGNTVKVITQDRVRGDSKETKYQFDRVFGPLSSQADVYAFIKPCVQKVCCSKFTTSGPFFLVRTSSHKFCN